MWFLGFVGVLLVGMFFAIPSNQSIQNNEIATQLEGQEKDSETSKPNIVESLDVDNELNNREDALSANIKKPEQTKLRVTMAQVGPDGTSVFGGVGPVGQTVLLFKGNTVIAEAIINENGDWVAIPKTMFEAGSH